MRVTEKRGMKKYTRYYVLLLGTRNPIRKAIRPPRDYHTCLALFSQQSRNRHDEYIFLSLTFTFRRVLDKPWSQVSSLFPPGGYPPSFLSRRFRVQNSRRLLLFSSFCFANSRARAFRGSFFAQQFKSP